MTRKGALERVKQGQELVCVRNVNRYYSDKPDTLVKFQKMIDSCECCFCGEVDNVSVGETTHWRVVHNIFLYTGARLHLLILPRRHVTKMSELTPGEFLDFSEAVRLAEKSFPMLRNGYGVAWRQGEHGGVTVMHLHVHLICPKLGRKGQATVNFGIG